MYDSRRGYAMGEVVRRMRQRRASRSFLRNLWNFYRTDDVGPRRHVPLVFAAPLCHSANLAHSFVTGGEEAMPERRRASLVTTLIMERPLCLQCIASKATATEAEVLDALASIQQSGLDLRTEHGRCRACGTETTVHRINRKGNGRSTTR